MVMGNDESCSVSEAVNEFREAGMLPIHSFIYLLFYFPPFKGAVEYLIFSPSGRFVLFTTRGHLETFIFLCCWPRSKHFLVQRGKYFHCVAVYAFVYARITLFMSRK